MISCKRLNVVLTRLGGKAVLPLGTTPPVLWWPQVLRTQGSWQGELRALGISQQGHQGWRRCPKKMLGVWNSATNRAFPFLSHCVDLSYECPRLWGRPRSQEMAQWAGPHQSWHQPSDSWWRQIEQAVPRRVQQSTYSWRPPYCLYASNLLTHEFQGV